MGVGVWLGGWAGGSWLRAPQCTCPSHINLHETVLLQARCQGCTPRTGKRWAPLEGAAQWSCDNACVRGDVTVCDTRMRMRRDAARPIRTAQHSGGGKAWDRRDPTAGEHCRGLARRWSCTAQPSAGPPVLLKGACASVCTVHAASFCRDKGMGMAWHGRPTGTPASCHGHSGPHTDT